MSSQHAAVVAESVDVVNLMGMEVNDLKDQLLAHTTRLHILRSEAVALRAQIAVLRTQRA